MDEFTSHLTLAPIVALIVASLGLLIRSYRTIIRWTAAPLERDICHRERDVLRTEVKRLQDHLDLHCSHGPYDGGKD